MAGYAVDVSRWGGAIDSANIDGWKNRQILRVIPGCGPGGYGLNFQKQAKVVVESGLALEAYTFYEWGYNIKMWIDAAIDSMGSYYKNVERFWIDVEDTNNTVPWDWKGILDIGFEYADSKFPEVGAYIPIWYMKSRMRDPQEIAVLGGKRRLWWNSWYDGNPDIDGMPYADLTADDIAIEQYQGSTDVAGFTVDLNYVYIEPKMEEDKMTPEQEQEHNALVALFGGHDNLIKIAVEQGMDLWEGYSEEQQKLAQHLANHPGSSVVANHYHKTTQQTITTGDVIQQ